MSENALVKAKRTEVATGGPAVDPFIGAGSDMAGSAACYMKFNGNSGEYTIGQDADEIPEGTELAVNMLEFKKGWICWKESEVVEEIMVQVAGGGKPPQQHELTDHGPYIKSDDQSDGWSAQVSVVFRNLTNGEEYTYKTSSKSAYRSMGALSITYGKQRAFHTPTEIPIVKLGSKSFEVKNKKFGKKYAPDILISRWVEQDTLIAQVSGEDADDYEQKALTAPADKTPATTAVKEAAAAPAEATPVTEAAKTATKTAAPAGDKPRPENARRGARRTF